MTSTPQPLPGHDPMNDDRGRLIQLEQLLKMAAAVAPDDVRTGQLEAMRAGTRDEIETLGGFPTAPMGDPPA